MLLIVVLFVMRDGRERCRERFDRGLIPSAVEPKKIGEGVGGRHYLNWHGRQLLVFRRLIMLLY